MATRRSRQRSTAGTNPLAHRVVATSSFRAYHTRLHLRSFRKVRSAGSTATSQKDRVGTATKAMRSKKLIKKAAVLPFEGNNIEEFVELEHEFLSVGQDKYVPHHTKRMVGIHGKIIENERNNLIASSREPMRVRGAMRKNKEGRPHANR